MAKHYAVEVTFSQDSGVYGIEHYVISANEFSSSNDIRRSIEERAIELSNSSTYNDPHIPDRIRHITYEERNDDSEQQPADTINIRDYLTLEQEEDIRVSLNDQYCTHRVTVPALEEIMFNMFPCLDHGFVRVIDYMGGDSSIVQAARVSYGRGTKKVNEDRGLVNYLVRHRHSTPLEMCEIKLHMKMPLFVARQFIRHRTANVNELSARYSILDREYYVPAPENCAQQSNVNRQGRGKTLTLGEANDVRATTILNSDQCYEIYRAMLNERDDGTIIDPSKPGLARELARMNLTLNFYTQWYWKIDLHNLFHFLTLRADPHAQYEARVYANVILDIVKRWVPIAAEAFVEHRLNALTLSSSAKTLIGNAIDWETVETLAESSGISARELGELLKAFGRI